MFKILQSGVYVDISQHVLRDSVSCTKSLSMDLEQPIGESTLSFDMVDLKPDNSGRVIPLAGNRVQWWDDKEGKLIFDGIIQEPSSSLYGFGASKVIKYSVSSKCPMLLFEKKLIEGQTFKTLNPGALIDQMAAVVDPRIVPATGNESGYAIDQLEVTSSTYKEALEEIAKAGGLFVWIDENWKIHHKKFETILGTMNDSKFNITDSSTNYLGLETRENIDKVVTRVHVHGSEMDAGTTNTENRKSGKKKRENTTYTKTAPLDAINIIRNRLGYSSLAVGTNPESLTVDSVGIIEKSVNAQGLYSQADLQLIADAELLQWQYPLTSGQVTYYDWGLEIGKSISINSQIRGVNTVLPITQIDVTANMGNDDYGYRKNTYTAYFNGASKIQQLKNKAKPKKEKKVKAELLIKPAPPSILGAKTFDEPMAVKSAYGVIIQRSGN